MKWRVPPTQGPSRVPDFTAGSLEMSAFLIFASPRGESVSPAMSGTTFDRSRILPWPSMMPGFSRPGAPKRTSFMFPPQRIVEWMVWRRPRLCVGDARAARLRPHESGMLPPRSGPHGEERREATRLEPWPKAPSMPPFFETRPSGAPQDEGSLGAAFWETGHDTILRHRLPAGGNHKC